MKKEILSRTEVKDVYDALFEILSSFEGGICTESSKIAHDGDSEKAGNLYMLAL